MKTLLYSTHYIHAMLRELVEYGVIPTPETRNPKPETLKPKPDRHPQTETRNLEPDAWVEVMLILREGGDSVCKTAWLNQNCLS
jgi:hypothetical protein